MHQGRGRIIAVVGVALVAVLLGVGAFAVGRSGSATTAGPAAAAVAETKSACEVVDHSPSGAATTAVAGLYQLALANLGEADPAPDKVAAVEKILDRYVIADQRARMRAYLSSARSTLTLVLDMPVGYQVVAYDPTTALIRLLVVDAGAGADGTAKAASGLIDVTLRWDETQGFWRMVSWPGNDDPAALAGLLRGVKGFCHTAT